MTSKVSQEDYQMNNLGGEQILNALKRPTTALISPKNFQRIVGQSIDIDLNLLRSHSQISFFDPKSPENDFNDIEKSNKSISYLNKIKDDTREIGDRSASYLENSNLRILTEQKENSSRDEGKYFKMNSSFSYRKEAK